MVPFYGLVSKRQASFRGLRTRHDWRVACENKADLLESDGFQQSALEYPGLKKEEIFESGERFYRRDYLRPKPILRINKTMLEDKAVCVRRLRGAAS